MTLHQLVGGFNPLNKVGRWDDYSCLRMRVIDLMRFGWCSHNIHFGRRPSVLVLSCLCKRVIDLVS